MWPGIFKLETGASSRKPFNETRSQKEKEKASAPKESVRKYQIFCFPFSVHVLWPEGSTGGRFRPGTDRARGHHKARVTFKRSSELFNPKHKTMRQTQNGIPFQKSPPLMFVPTLCLLDNCLQSALKLYTVPTCGAQHSPKKQTKKKQQLSCMNLQLPEVISTYGIQSNAAS